MKKLYLVLGLFLFVVTVSPVFQESYSSQSYRLDEMDLQGLQIFNIPQIAPKPANSDDMQRIWFNDPEDGTYVDIFDSGYMEMFVPVYLPHGATIKKFALLVVHDYSGEHLEVYLVRQDPFTNTQIPLAEASTEGLPTSGSVRVLLDETIDEPIVKNTRYDYFVLVYFSHGGGTDLAFRGARIAYE